MKSPEIKLLSNYKFGFFFSTIFLLASLYSYYINSEIMAYVLGTLCGIFLVTTIINAKILLPLNKLWMKFGILLGMIVSPVIMGIIYFGVFTPIAIVMRLAGRDELRLQLKKQKTHWVNRKILNKVDLFKNQF
ncbi:SxtJ family membrane protein [Candidatus Pelagibacter sp.]|nr:SxtJ family membrane protein [Candidatus Pelagibacter sp.]